MPHVTISLTIEIEGDLENCGGGIVVAVALTCLYDAYKFNNIIVDVKKA